MKRKNKSFKLLRTAAILTVLVLTIGLPISLMAQDDTISLAEQDESSSRMEVTTNAHFRKYAADWGHLFSFDMLFPVSERLRLGVGAYMEINYSKREPQWEKNPYEGLEASRRGNGLAFIAQYQLSDKVYSRRSLVFRLYTGWVDFGFTAKAGDKCCRDCFSYDITPEDRTNWGPHFQVTPQISYAYDWLFFHLEFYVGYELINPIYREYRDAPTRLSSPWRGFRTEYPEMTLNPFEEWGCGQKLSGMSGFYMGVSIGIPSPMID